MKRNAEGEDVTGHPLLGAIEHKKRQGKELRRMAEQCRRTGDLEGFLIASFVAEGMELDRLAIEAELELR